VLFVAHGFPPDSWAGVEVLTLTLARALRARGHEVALFVRSPGTPEEADRSLHVGEFDGFRVHRYVNRLAFSGVDETYRFLPAEAAFDRVLAAERPDVVHVQHMIHLSTGIVDRCRAAGVPCVVTLSDFWARCPRVQLIRPNRSNCRVPPPGLGCAACVKDKPAWIDPLARLDRLLGRLPERWAARVPQTIPAHPPGWSKSREDAASLVRRERHMREMLLRADALVVPGVTLKQAFVELGLPASRIALSAYGMDTGWCRDGPPERVPRAPGEPLRVGFLGSLVWYKGLSVVAQAVAAMAPGSAHLHVHGDHEGGADPVAAAACREVAGEARAIARDRITFHGRYHHDDLAAIHARLDVLVVPSVWQEAYGITVREAFLSRTPVVGSDIAGIAEGIEHDVNGLLFRTGDAEALRAALQRFVDEPELAARLSAAAPPVKTDAEEAAEMEWRYRQVIGARGRVSRTPRARA
jgi:glycosyltransferase involved in cell wall biosynthesis